MKEANQACIPSYKLKKNDLINALKNKKKCDMNDLHTCISRKSLIQEAGNKDIKQRWSMNKQTLIHELRKGLNDDNDFCEYLQNLDIYLYKSQMTSNTSLPEKRISNKEKKKN